MEEHRCVHWSLKDHIATVTLADPHKPNPLNVRLQQQLLQALQEALASEQARAIVLRSEGKAFCVGADLGEMRDAAGVESSLGAWTASFMTQWLNPIVLTLKNSRVPVVCAVHGAAAGAGAGLAMAADFLLMSHASYLYLPFVPKLGILPDMGCTWHLPRRVGASRALGMMLLGDQIPAAQAVASGIAWDCFAVDSLDEEAQRLAQRLAALPQGAVVEVRNALRAAEHNTLAQQLEYECAHQRELIDQPAFTEGVNAFFEKRAPSFT